MTPILGDTKEKLITQLAKYRYYAKNPRIMDEESGEFVLFISNMLHNGTIDKECEKFEITETEIKQELADYETGKKKVGGKKSRKKSRKHKKRKYKKSKKYCKKKSRNKRR